jgi:hypothetical protein
VPTGKRTGSVRQIARIAIKPRPRHSRPSVYHGPVSLHLAIASYSGSLGWTTRCLRYRSIQTVIVQ